MSALTRHSSGTRPEAGEPLNFTLGVTKVSMHELTMEEYEATICPAMVNVTDSTEEIVDLWSYADPIIESKYHSCTAWKWRVDHVYETPDGHFQHIGIPVPIDETYLIVIIDKPNRLIIGHYILNLGASNNGVEVHDT